MKIDWHMLKFTNVCMRGSLYYSLHFCEFLKCSNNKKEKYGAFQSQNFYRNSPVSFFDNTGLL